MNHSKALGIPITAFYTNKMLAANIRLKSCNSKWQNIHQSCLHGLQRYGWVMEHNLIVWVVALIWEHSLGNCRWWSAQQWQLSKMILQAETFESVSHSCLDNTHLKNKRNPLAMSAFWQLQFQIHAVVCQRQLNLWYGGISWTANTENYHFFEKISAFRLFFSFICQQLIFFSEIRYTTI